MPYRFQLAETQHLANLPSIELAAAAQFPLADLPAPLRHRSTPIGAFKEAQQRQLLWVAIPREGGQPVGFLLADQIADRLHIAELDVHPDHARRGIGSRLVQQLLHAAVNYGVPAVTLTTFTHLPWNAPFYRQLGFEELPRGACDAPLSAILKQEADNGLANRVAMLYDLSDTCVQARAVTDTTLL